MLLDNAIAGKGTEVGRNFEELQEILSRVKISGENGSLSGIPAMF